MFGFLKKKLRDSIDKLSEKVKKKEAPESVELFEEEVEKEFAKKIVPDEFPEEKEGVIKRLKKKIIEKRISESDIKDALAELQISLIQSDVAVGVAERIIDDLKKELIGKSVKRKEIEKLIKGSMKKSILDILDVDGFDLIKRINKKAFLIVFLGFNGSGKTTTIARVGKLLNDNNLKCIFAAADTWRAASIEQLEEHGKNLGINVIKQKYLSDPAAVVFDGVKHAKAKDIDVVLADTAGRSHANVNLMDELKKIIRVNKPDLKILVLDALTGNDIYDQCKLFNDAVGVDGLIITKADVYDKGGAALSAAYTINKPLLFLGTGQDYKDLEKFDAEKIVENLLS